MHVLEGESLLNDASGLVCFRFAVAAALTGTFSAPQATLTFIQLAVAGVIAGSGLTYTAMRLKHWISRRLGEEAGSQVLISLLIPFGAYELAERLGGSGILAAVAAGITMSYIRVVRWSPCNDTDATHSCVGYGSVRTERRDVRSTRRATAGNFEQRHRRRAATRSIRPLAAGGLRAGHRCRSGVSALRMGMDLFPAHRVPGDPAWRNAGRETDIAFDCSDVGCRRAWSNHIGRRAVATLGSR